MQFTEDQIAFRDALKRFIDKEVVPIADEVDRNDRFPAELVPKFGDMGLLQLRLPEEYGGPGANLTTVCIAAEEFAKVSESIALISGQNGIAIADGHRQSGLERPRITARGKLIAPQFDGVVAGRNRAVIETAISANRADAAVVGRQPGGCLQFELARVN